MSPTPPRIYLDNAATSWPKAPEVLEAIVEFYTHHGTAIGRGSYAAAEGLQRKVNELRGQIARLINAERPDELIWTFNGTDALNIGIVGMLRPGDHVVTTEAEHNSVLRPLEHCRTSLGVETTIVECEPDGSVLAETVVAAIRPATRLVCLTAASNVTGAANELEPVGAACRAHDKASLLVDAAQVAGYLPIDVRAIGCDLLAAPGHKGLGGPLGTGFLYARQAIWNRLQPIRWGGTGTVSHEARQPDTVPDKFESGNLDGANLMGLRAALEQGRRVDGWRYDWRQTDLFNRFQQLLIGLRAIPQVRVWAANELPRAVPVVSFTIPAMDSREVAAVLDSRWHIECRAGFHCAPLICRRLGTLAHGGTVRVSPGPRTTEEEIGTLLSAIKSLVRSGG